jgi:hypothetical protein
MTNAQGLAVGVATACVPFGIVVGARQDVSYRRSAGFSILMAVCALLAGCRREDAIVRLPVRGAVSIRSGEQLSGSISFLPANGHKGPAATTTIVAGTYRFDQTNGPTAGPHRVIIKRIIPKSDMLQTRGSRNPGAPKDVPQGSGPRTEWTATANVTEQNLDQCDFQLEP